MSRFAVIATLLLLVPLAATADQFGTRVLVPVMTSGDPLPGAHGSLWTTQLIGTNNSDTPVEVGFRAGCALPEGCGTLRPPHLAFFPAYNVDPNGGAFLYVGNLAAISLELRVQDISRQSQTWGTEIPVVYEQDLFASTLHLVDVTLDPRFRATLRIYDFDPADDRDSAVRIRIYDLCGIDLINQQCAADPYVDTTVTLRKSGSDTNTPHSAVFPDLVASFPILSSVPPKVVGPGAPRPASVRIDIDPVAPADLRFWAFATVTNDETQHVTAITPQSLHVE